MSYKFLFFLTALICIILGAALLFVPEMTLDQFQGPRRFETEVPYARMLGSSFLVMGLMSWFAKDTSDMNLQKNFGIVGLIGSVLAVVVTILAISKGLITAYTWAPLVIEVILGLGYAFMIFLKPKMKE